MQQKTNNHGAMSVDYKIDNVLKKFKCNLRLKPWTQDERELNEAKKKN